MSTFYVAALNLEDYLVDKDTGAPLAGGYIQFWEDANRTNPKPVFQKQNIGADPVTGDPIYRYVQLSNPVQLSGVGTPQDANGNNVLIYYYPFDVDGNVQLYYVAVFNSLGVPQFVREGWPSIEEASSAAVAGVYQNMLLNPQFASVYFGSAGLTHNYTGVAEDVFSIGPYWDLIVNHSGDGSLTVTRTSVQGSLKYATNPPYILNVTAGVNIRVLQLRQRLTNTPAVWGATVDGVNGFVASYALVAPGSNIEIKYAPSIGPVTRLLRANNTSGVYTGFPATVELPLSTNTANSDTGYVDILITLPTTGTTSFSSIQVVGLDANVQGIDYVQTPVTKQLAELGINQIDVYTRLVPSYLVGWDFPMNPSQFSLATILPQATGNNKSFYIRDQTIAFQSKNNGISISNDTTNALRVTAAAEGQHALIQYMPAPQAIELLSSIKCINISANCSTPTTATVSLWYTNGILPSTIGLNNSLVASLDVNGYPTTTIGWLPIPCNGTGNGSNGQQITIQPVTSPFTLFNQYPLNSWAPIINNSATYMAIIIGTGVMPAASYINYQSISCQSGNSPTLPAPKSFAQNLQDCQQYYWSTFPYNVIPSTGTGYLGAIGVTTIPVYTGGSTGSNVVSPNGVNVIFPVRMNQTPVLNAYNPINANSNWHAPSVPGDVYNSSFGVSTSTNGFYVFGTPPSTTGNVSIPAYVHVTADARLGR
jgi:hypothetical protein